MDNGDQIYINKRISIISNSMNSNKIWDIEKSTSIHTDYKICNVLNVYTWDTELASKWRKRFVTTEKVRERKKERKNTLQVGQIGKLWEVFCVPYSKKQMFNIFKTIEREMKHGNDKLKWDWQCILDQHVLSTQRRKWPTMSKMETIPKHTNCLFCLFPMKMICREYPSNKHWLLHRKPINTVIVGNTKVSKDLSKKGIVFSLIF
jgi:hypothetical protein